MNLRDRLTCNLSRITSVRVAAIMVLVAFSVMMFASDSGAVRKKARYYFLEGVMKEAERKYDDAHELFRKALLIDPTYIDAKVRCLTNEIYLLPQDSVEQKNALLKQMSRIIETYPDDMNYMQYYASMAQYCNNIDEAIRVYKIIYDKSKEKSEIVMTLSELYSEGGKIDSALMCLNRYEEIEGQSDAISSKKSVYKIELGDTIGAIAEMDTLIKANPTDPLYHLLKGEILFYISKYEQSKECFLMAEQLAPDKGIVKEIFAKYYKDISDTVAYGQKVREAVKCEDYDVEKKVELTAEYLGFLVQSGSDVTQAEDIMMWLYEEYPINQKVLEFVAEYKFYIEDISSGVEVLKQLTELQPGEVFYWSELIWKQLALGRYEEIIETYHRSMDYITPANSMKSSLAVAYLMQKEYEKSLEIYTSLIQEFSPSLSTNKPIDDIGMFQNFSFQQLELLSNYYSIIGDLYQNNLNDSESAIIAYENSLLLNPENASTLNNYAYLLLEQGGDIVKIEQMTEKALRCGPDSHSILDTYAMVLFKKGEYSKALEYQEKAYSKEIELMGKSSREVLEHLGDIYYMNDMPDKALSHWEEALKLDPDNKLLQEKVKQKRYLTE